MSTAEWCWRGARILLTVAVVCYGALVVLAPLLANRALYQPQFGSRRAPAGLRLVPAGNGGEIAVLHLPNPSARYTVWFFHGNAEDLGDLEPFLGELRAAGYGVFAFDYPGYGRSTGRPSEESLYAAARAARRHLRETLGVPPERTLVFGRSLGSGPAVQMAAEERVGGLIVQSGFASVYRVLTRWRLLPFDQFENARKLPRIASPVLVMHGTADEVIPLGNGEALFAAAREPKRAVWVPGAHHNDFTEVAGDAYWRALREFADRCAATKPVR